MSGLGDQVAAVPGVDDVESAGGGTDVLQAQQHGADARAEEAVLVPVPAVRAAPDVPGPDPDRGPVAQLARWEPELLVWNMWVDWAAGARYAAKWIRPRVSANHLRLTESRCTGPGRHALRSRVPSLRAGDGRRGRDRADPFLPLLPAQWVPRHAAPGRIGRRLQDLAAPRALRRQAIGSGRAAPVSGCSRDDPLMRLSGHVGDPLVVGVIVEHDGGVGVGDRGEHQIRDRGPVLSTQGQRGHDVRYVLLGGWGHVQVGK